MKSETIDQLIKSEPTAVSMELVERFMLQQHRSLLLRLVMLRMTFRIFYFIIIVLIILANSITERNVFVYFTPIILMSLLWSFENYSVQTQIRMVERTLAHSSGGSWEDIYIKSRYEIREKISTRLQNLEPALWNFLILAELIVKRFLV